MPTTIRDLLSEPALGLELLVDGDLDRTVRWVHVTELADASPYLVGDELVLTAGVWRGRRHSAEGFVRSLKTRDVAGIGYGLLVGDDGVPAAVQRACREASVPLLAVPISTPFVAISQWFVERLAQDREQSLRETLRLTSELLSAAEARSSGEALDAVARLLWQSTGAGVWIGDGAGGVLASAGQAPDEDTRGLIAAAVATGSTVVEEWTVQPVISGGTRAAVLAIAGAADDLETLARVDAARPVIGLILARQRAIVESERRTAGEVISLVLSRQVEVAAARMTYYGLDPSGRLLALVCAVQDRDHALGMAEHWLADSALNGVVAVRGDELTLVLDAEHVPDPGEAVAVARSLAVRVSAVAAGAGSVADDITDLRRSLVQAHQACELARRRRNGTVLSHDQTGSHEMLLALQDHDVLDAFREAILTPLEDFDAANGTDLVTTLRTFLGTGGRWQASARLLHVHVNTLRNRLDRVEVLTRRSIGSTPDRVDLWLALQVANVQTPVRHD